MLGAHIANRVQRAPPCIIKCLKNIIVIYKIFDVQYIITV